MAFRATPVRVVCACGSPARSASHDPLDPVRDRVDSLMLPHPDDSPATVLQYLIGRLVPRDVAVQLRTPPLSVVL
jgi:hypothetical protein